MADWNFACPDWAERLSDGRSLLPNLPLDEAAAAKAVAVFDKLRLPDVEGQPFLRDSGSDWVRDMVRAALGSWDVATRTRHVREIFGLVPKKNNKTTGASALALTAAIQNKRPNAELHLFGPTQDIAGLAFDQIWGMIEADEEKYLARRFRIRDHIKTIEDRETGSELRIITFDKKVATGGKPIFVLLDELHIMASASFAARLVGQIEGNMVANPEALLVTITTQSDEAPSGIFKQKLAYARGVRDGRITDDVHLLPLIYEFPEAFQRDPAKPWMNPRSWHRVLPNLGYSVSIDRLEQEFKKARDQGEEELRRWASQHLNVEIGMALHADRWIGADYWEAAAEPGLTLEQLLERCDVVTAGIDGGGLDDLLALCLLGRDRETREWLAWFRAWAQEDVFERRKDIVARLEDFIADGDLVRCSDPERPTQDLEELADILVMVFELGLFPEKAGIGLDAAGIAALIDELVSRGIPAELLVAIAQGYRLSGAIWGSERKLKDGTLGHCGQAIATWCVGNAKAEQRGNAVLITKEAAGKAKIDPLMALFDAASLMARNPEAAGGAGSVYDDLARLAANQAA